MMYPKIYVKIVFTSSAQRRGFAIKANPSDTFKNVKNKIMTKIRRAGIELYNSKLVQISGMKQGQRVKDLENKLLYATQVIRNG